MAWASGDAESCEMRSEAKGIPIRPERTKSERRVARVPSGRAWPSHGLIFLEWLSGRSLRQRETLADPLQLLEPNPSDRQLPVHPPDMLKDPSPSVRGPPRASCTSCEGANPAKPRKVRCRLCGRGATCAESIQPCNSRLCHAASVSRSADTGSFRVQRAPLWRQTHRDDRWRPIEPRCGAHAQSAKRVADAGPRGISGLWTQSRGPKVRIWEIPAARAIQRQAGMRCCSRILVWPRTCSPPTSTILLRKCHWTPMVKRGCTLCRMICIRPFRRIAD